LDIEKWEQEKGKWWEVSKKDKTDELLIEKTSREELSRILKRKGKAAGKDGIKLEMVEKSPENIKNEIVEWFNRIMRGEIELTEREWTSKGWMYLKVKIGLI